MIIHDVVQGSPEWYKLRNGVFTASTFGKILTPSTQRVSTSSEALEDEIAGQILTGEYNDEEDDGYDDEFGGSYFTERGKRLEPKAIQAYEIMTGETVKRAGFITNDAGTIGASVDGLVGDDGIVEIKCLKRRNHVSLFRKKQISAKHVPQCQGQMLVLEGRKWCDNFFYHPKIRPFLIRLEKDVIYCAKLEAALNQMVINVADKVAQLRGE